MNFAILGSTVTVSHPAHFKPEFDKFTKALFDEDKFVDWVNNTPDVFLKLLKIKGNIKLIPLE